MYSEGMTLQQEATNAIANAEFRQAWPIEVRRVLVRAAKTEGEFPAFAVKEVKWALKQARETERKCERDIAQGLASLSPIERRKLAV